MLMEMGLLVRVLLFFHNVEFIVCRLFPYLVYQIESFGYDYIILHGFVCLSDALFILYSFVQML